MSQPNTFLTKTIDELSSHVPKKQTNVVDVCNRIQKQIHTDGYSDKLMKGTEECIVPLLELVEVTFQAKNYTLCARVVDLIDKLILYKAISHTPIKYKNSEQAVDVVVTIVNILINLFHYNSLPTNLYVAKCLTTIVDVFTLSLHSTYVIASFQTIFDMYVVTPITDVNNGAYQMCVGRIVDIITTKSTPNSVTSSSALLSTLSLLCSEHWSLRESPPKLVTFSSSVTSESKLQLDQKQKNSSLELLETFLEKLPTDIHSTFCDSVFAADVALPVVAANGNDLSTFKLAVRILETLIEKYRDYLKGALGTICKVFVIPSLKQSTDRAKCILDVLQRADGNLFIELFANFDCDVSSPDVFEDIILGVVNLLKTPLADDALILLESLYQGLNRATEPWVSTLKTLLADESPAPTSELDIVALKEKKKIVAEGLEIFSNKPAKGIEYFQDKKLCGTEPLEVVQFLNSLSCIDRTALGTFLGGAGDFNQQCLTAMLTILNFEGLEIDEALRVLFRGFVMGGEGQVVERVMGAFSKEYSKSSVTIYGELEPDALFQLAMTVVCLATESHNPSVKVRAFDTFEKFQTIITTDAGFSIPVNPKLLQNTFNRVVATPFEIVQVTADNAAASLLKPQGTYSRQISAEIVREMHVAIYLPVTIESSHHAFTSTPTALNRAVTILTISIHLSAVYYLETALATSLRLLSSLARIDQPTFITQSHLPAIRALLQVSSVDGEFLSVGWSNYITSLFEIERLRQLAKGWDNSSTSLPSSTRPKVFPNTYTFGQRSESPRPSPSRAIAEIDDAEINAVFYDSATLGRRAAKAFFRALCDGVLTQIDSKSSGVFALQMLVVAASSNMNRSEREWASLWDALSGLFIKCCVHPNPNVACSAVDALRQIVAHFSETEEVDEKNQERALAPFVVAIADHESDTVRDFAVTALKSFISNNGWGKKLKSGWIPVLQSLRFAAEFNSSKSEGFSTLQLVFEKHHDVISNHFDLFVNALIAFQRTCGKESEEIAMKVTEITSQILLDVTVEEINDISEGDQLTLNGISYDSSFVEQRMISRTTQPLPSIAQNYLIQYMPLLTSLAASALSTYSNVSSFAIETIQKHIQTLPSQLQPIVFYRTIYRCFTPDIIQANTSTLESILTYSTTLPLTTILPVVSYCFNMLLNHLPSQSPCLHFLKTILQHPDFSTIHKQFLTLQIHYFEIALSSIRLDPPHNFTSQPRPKPSTTTPCHKCHTPHVTYLMKRCPGCLQEYYCTNCSDSHIIECIHTWKEWSLFHIAAPNVTYCGLTNYLTMLSTDVISSLLLDSITSLYANLKTNLATHTEALLDCFETVSKIMFRYRVALMPSAPELVTTELKEEFTSIASAIITGFTQTETKNIVLDALDVVTTLDDTNFLMICSTVIPQLIETILVDDVEVRKLVTKLFVRIFKLHPIML